MFSILQEGLANVSGLSMELNIPIQATMSSFIGEAFKNLLSISIESNYNFTQSEKVKEYLKNPSKFQSTATTTTTSEQPKKEAGKKDEKKKEEKKEEPKKEEPKKEEEDDGLAGGFDLFGGGGE